VKFSLGNVCATPGALHALERADTSLITLLGRHATGDWGIVCKEDAKANEDALRYGARILSAYKLRDGTKVWLITEADRSVTTLLLPDEY
jgi:hypothetical protein